MPLDPRIRSAAAFVTWAAAAGGAWWLYHEGPGTPAAVAIVQAREYRLSPPQLARLVALDAVEGQRVGASQVVARFDTGLLQREMSVAGAQLRQAASEVNAAGGALDANVVQAERLFRAEIDAVAVELEDAKAGEKRERSELQSLLQDIARERDLVKRGLTRSDRLVALDLRRAALEESVKTWRPRIEAIEARQRAAAGRLEDWRRTHDPANGGSRDAQLRPLEARVSERRESMELIKARMDQSVLRTGESAYVVSKIHARPGDIVKPGDPVVTLVETRPRTAIAYIDERRGKPLPVGSKVLAARRGGTQRWEATIAAVAPDVAELPQRLWANPQLPAWGRAMYVTLPRDAEFDPGDLLDITSPPGAPIGTMRAER